MGASQAAPARCNGPGCDKRTTRSFDTIGGASRHPHLLDPCICSVRRLCIANLLEGAGITRLCVGNMVLLPLLAALKQAQRHRVDSFKRTTELRLNSSRNDLWKLHQSLCRCLNALKRKKPSLAGPRMWGVCRNYFLGQCAALQS